VIATEATESRRERMLHRIAIPEIAERLGIGRLAVYSMLEKKIIPGVRLGRRWIVTLAAYEHWERNCGTAEARADLAVHGPE
jgi:excisionase family DNA binding protein